jgi:hypothetical protein
MRTAFVIALCMLSTATLAQFPVQRPTETAILEKQGDGARIIIDKAYSILSHARLLATCNVGDGATPEACWALTIVVKHDKQALAQLTELLMSLEEPVPKLYVLAAMMAVDPKTAERWPISNFPAKLREAPVQSMRDCNIGFCTFEEALPGVYEFGSALYILKELPSIYQTTDIAPRELK